MRVRRSSLRRAAWPLVAACLVGTNAGAEGLERLFSTPQERERLDALRRSAEHGPPSAPESPAEQAAVSARLTVNGLVVRERGPDSMWINGERVSRGAETREGIRVHGEAGGRVRVILPHDAGAVRLKAGQKVDLATGAVRDAYEPDAPAPPSSGPLLDTGMDASGR